MAEYKLKDGTFLAHPTAGKIREAAKGCPDAARVLKQVFPEAFEEEATSTILAQLLVPGTRFQGWGAEYISLGSGAAARDFANSINHIYDRGDHQTPEKNLYMICPKLAYGVQTGWTYLNSSSVAACKIIEPALKGVK